MNDVGCVCDEDVCVGDEMNDVDCVRGGDEKDEARCVCVGEDVIGTDCVCLGDEMDVVIVSFSNSSTYDSA